MACQSDAQPFKSYPFEPTSFQKWYLTYNLPITLHLFDWYSLLNIVNYINNIWEASRIQHIAEFNHWLQPSGLCLAFGHISDLHQLMAVVTYQREFSHLNFWHGLITATTKNGSTRSKFARFHTQRHQILERGLKYEYRRAPELLSTSSTMGKIFAAILRTTSHRTSIVTVTQPRAVSTWHHIVDKLMDTHINFHLCPHGQALTVFVSLQYSQLFIVQTQSNSFLSQAWLTGDGFITTLMHIFL